MPKVRVLPKLEKKKTFFFFVLVVLTLLVVALLPRLSIPIIIAYVIYLIISPAVLWVQKLGLSRSNSTIVVFLGFLLFSILPFVKTVPVIIKETENIQYYLPKLESYLIKKSNSLQEDIKEKVGYTFDDAYLPKMIDVARSNSTTFLFNLTNYLGVALEWIFLIPLIVFFLLKDGTKFKKAILSLAPNSFFERFYFLTHKFNSKLGNYILAKFIEAGIVGTIIWVGLMVIGVRFSVLLALVAALTNIIPYVGPVIGFLPALIFALAEYGTNTTFGAIVILYLVANVIDMAIVFPLLVSKVVDLHPMIVVISVIVGGQWLGIVGMVISIPLAAAFKLVFEEIYKELYLRN